MPPIVIDLVIAFLILLLTYALSSEGLWGSALMFFNILFSAIIAFNFYEPLAALLARNLSFLSGFADTLCLMSLFIVSVVLMRLTTESIAPAMVRFPVPLYQFGRLAFALAGGTVMMAFLLVAFETAPVHKKVFYVVDYKYAPPFKLGLDREFLGFFQYTTGYIFAKMNGPSNDPRREFPASNVFDPNAEWLIRHQDARPYGTESVLGTEAPPAEGAAGGGGGGGGAPGGQTGGERPGDPKIIGAGTGMPVVVPN